MRAIISLASNSGDKKSNLNRMVDEIRKQCRILRYSGEYLTDATDGTSSPYLNAVAEIESEERADVLDKKFKEIEIMLGRDEESRRRKEVPCDIDIVEADGKILRKKDSMQQYYRIGIDLLNPSTSNPKPLNF